MNRYVEDKIVFWAHIHTPPLLLPIRGYLLMWADKIIDQRRRWSEK